MPTEIDQSPQFGVTLKAIAPREERPTGSGLRHDLVIPPMPGTHEWGHKARTWWIARHMPRYFQHIRRGFMFDGNSAWAVGGKEVKCPACVATPGWLDVQTLVACPICGGFVDIPEYVGFWYLQHDAALVGETKLRKQLTARVEIERSQLPIRQQKQRARMPAMMIGS